MIKKTSHDGFTPLLDFPRGIKALLAHAEDCAWAVLSRYGIQHGDREMWMKRWIPLKETPREFQAASRILNNVHQAETLVKRLDREGHLETESVGLLVHHVAVVAQALVFVPAFTDQKYLERAAGDVHSPGPSDTGKAQVRDMRGQGRSTADLVSRLETSLRRMQQIVGDESP